MRIVFCSCPSEQAENLARDLVENRVAACVQVIPKITSYYRWEGDICQDKESLLLIKTEKSVLEKLTSRLKKLHPYTIPEILSVAVKEEESNSDYLEWVIEETSKKTLG